MLPFRRFFILSFWQDPRGDRWRHHGRSREVLSSGRIGIYAPIGWWAGEQTPGQTMSWDRGEGPPRPSSGDAFISRSESSLVRYFLVRPMYPLVDSLRERYEFRIGFPTSRTRHRSIFAKHSPRWADSFVYTSLLDMGMDVLKSSSSPFFKI